MEYTLQDLLPLNDSYHRGHTLNQTDVDIVNRMVKIIENNSRGDKIAAGDIVEAHGYRPYEDKDVVYENAHIDTLNYLDTFGTHICVKPYTPFVFDDDGKPTFSTSGGYWFNEKNPNKFKHIGKRLKNFCVWGHNGARGNGAVYFQCLVNVWEYHNKELIY
jgi:hypothetical protein